MRRCADDDARPPGGGTFGGDVGIDGGLEGGVVLFEPAVQGAGLEEVGDTEQNLGAVERLGEEVLGSRGQRQLLDLDVDVGGEHEDGQEASGGHEATEGLHDCEPVQVGHVQIEQDQVGQGPGAVGHRLPGVGEPVHLGDPCRGEEPSQQGDVGRGVVDDDHRGPAGCCGERRGRVVHLPMVPFGCHREPSASSRSPSTSRTSMGLVM